MQWPGWRFGQPIFTNTTSAIMNKPYHMAQSLANGGAHFDKNGHARVEVPYYSKFERLFTQSSNPSTTANPYGFQQDISLTDSIGMVYISGSYQVDGTTSYPRVTLEANQAIGDDFEFQYPKAVPCFIVEW